MTKVVRCYTRPEYPSKKFWLSMSTTRCQLSARCNDELHSQCAGDALLWQPLLHWPLLSFSVPPPPSWTHALLAATRQAVSKLTSKYTERSARKPLRSCEFVCLETDKHGYFTCKNVAITVQLTCPLNGVWGNLLWQHLLSGPLPGPASSFAAAGSWLPLFHAWQQGPCSETPAPAAHHTSRHALRSYALLVSDCMVRFTVIYGKIYPDYVSQRHDMAHDQVKCLHVIHLLFLLCGCL